ncbi:MAG: hypothetical protein PHV17_06930 [Candidatus Omnitrophica bacterium]|nr:hypothetical protein [Candidatus Omnitrophota bacterium]
MDNILKNNNLILKRLIWGYFFLLIFEGALRKWFFPALTAPLMIVRDPVVLLIYVISLKKKQFPVNLFIGLTFFLLILTLITSLFNGSNNLFILFYGLRSNFFYIPLIFIIGKTFDFNDVKCLGKIVLIISIPMTILAILQFINPCDHFLNIAVDVAGTQISSAFGRIRPAATFSYVTGTAQFFTLASAFIFYGLIERKSYPLGLVIFSLTGLIVTMVISGSRLLIVMVFFVFTAAMIIYISKKHLKIHWFRFILIFFTVFVFLYFIRYFPFFQTGLDVLQYRFFGLDQQHSLSYRALKWWSEIMKSLANAPFFGFGAGKGTNVAAQILIGQRAFILQENNYCRIILENGPLLGLSFISFKLLLTGFLFKESLKEFFNANSLPLLLFAADVILISKTNWSQTTTLGFAVFTAGLILAAANQKNHEF